MSKGFIKLHRSLKDWEWYDDIPATRLLVHLLIRVNYKPKHWKGKLINPGSIITSWEKLASETGLSVRQCRTAMKKLETSNEVTRKTTSKYQVVTLIKWEKLQFNANDDDKQEAFSLTSERQTNDRQSTTTKEGKEYKESKEVRSIKKKYTKKDFKKALLDLGAQEQHIDDWFTVRAQKKAAFTKTAFTKFFNECKKNKYPVANAVKICAERSWVGFEYKWLKNIKNEQPTINRQTEDTYEQNGRGW